ncbi:hypothetical protein SH528x_003002 [Novipirellula sp. SH528]|uniref:hypothetical protein n=1 Tax=Novipirellula sp. SH528 TaxID=3454466 RepID=UPI003FA14AAD
MQTFPIWFIFIGLATPIALLAIASISLAHEPFSATDPELIDTDIVTGQTYTDDGTVTRTYSVTIPGSRNTTIFIGPLALTANARAWAGYSALLGILLLGIGICGMLHFPTQTSAPVIPFDAATTDDDADPAPIPNGG